MKGGEKGISSWLHPPSSIGHEGAYGWEVRHSGYEGIAPLDSFYDLQGEAGRPGYLGGNLSLRVLWSPNERLLRRMWLA